MKSTLWFLFIAALGNFSYHIGQKALPQNANPMMLLMVIYAIAFASCAALLPFFKDAETLSVVQLLSVWQIWLVALGVLLIEIGFLLAYRGGGSLQWSGVAVNGAAALMLIPVAIFVFRESLSLDKIIGIATTLIGLYFWSKSKHGTHHEPAFLHQQRFCRIRLGRQSIGDSAIAGRPIARHRDHAAYRAAIQSVRNRVHHTADRAEPRGASADFHT